MTCKATPFIYKRGMCSLLEKEDNSSIALELNIYTVYMLSTADKLRHTKHTLQYLAHV